MKNTKIFSEEFKGAVLRLLQEQKEQPLSERQIAEKLSVRGGARKRLGKLLGFMAREGAIVCVRNNCYGMGAPADLVTGDLEMRRSGDGIVYPRDGSDEVFVPEDSIGTALAHDLVVARLSPDATERERGLRRTGKIIRILERSRRAIVGTLRATGKFYYVVPIDPVYARDFYVADPKGARVNDRVVIQCTTWANRHVNPEAEIIEVIGPESNPSHDTMVIMRHYALPDKFPPEVLRESGEAIRLIDQPGERRDLRNRFIFTIDPATARDFDDAISLEMDAGNRRILGVHIADVSHFVRPGTALDAEACQRGNSVYFPDLVLPMLPETISNGVCSLRPDEDRLAFSVMITFDSGGVPVGAEFFRSIIRSRLRLTYEQALEALNAGGRPTRAVGPEAARLLRQCHALAGELRRRRFAQCALNLDLPEYEIFVGRNGLIEEIRQTSSDISHQLIEEFMIAANEAVDRALSEKGLDLIRRVHEPPDAKKIEALAGQLAEMGFRPGDLSKRKNMSAFLDSLNGHPFEYDAKLAVLKSMKRAVYSPEPLGHYGLAKKYYAHFTSPIRRYPDLVAHRALAAMLAGRGGAQRRADLNALGKHFSRAEQTADEAEKALIEIKKYRFLEQQIASRKPEVYEAIVVSVKNFGMFVELTSLRIQGLVHISSISREFVRYNQPKRQLLTSRKKYSAGTRVRVIPSRIDFDKRQIDFVLAEDTSRAPGRRQEKTQHGKPQGARHAG